MTTAQLREKAREAEKHLLWGAAADFWQAAIDAYPNPVGQLAKRDIERMQARADACLRSYFPN